MVEAIKAVLIILLHCNIERGWEVIYEAMVVLPGAAGALHSLYCKGMVIKLIKY